VVVSLACMRPKGLGRKPTAAELARLDARQSVLEAALAAQRERLDIEGLRAAFASMLQLVGDLQGVRTTQTTIDLSPAKIDELCGVQSLVQVPRISGSLQHLKLDCRALQVLPAWMQRLAALQDLRVYGGDASTMAHFPSEFEDLPQLRSLVLHNFPDTHWLIMSAAQLSMLQSLTVKDSSTLIDLPDLRDSRVDVLRLHHCLGLKDLRGLCAMQLLRQLSLSRCRVLVRLPSFAGLVSLEELIVDNCGLLRALPGDIGGAPLRILSIHHARSLQNVAHVLSPLRALEELVLCDCGLETAPTCIERCARLERLNIVIYKSDNTPAFGAMAAVLPRLHRLQALILSTGIQRNWNQIQREWNQPLCDRLNSNYLGDADLCSIAGTLQSYPPPHLTTLKLSLAKYFVHGCGGPASLDDASIMEFWRVQQCKLLWFVFGCVQNNSERASIAGTPSVLVQMIGDLVMKRTGAP